MLNSTGQIQMCSVSRPWGSRGLLTFAVFMLGLCSCIPCRSMNLLLEYKMEEGKKYLHLNKSNHFQSFSNAWVVSITLKNLESSGRMKMGLVLCNWQILWLKLRGCCLFWPTKITLLRQMMSYCSVPGTSRKELSRFCCGGFGVTGDACIPKDRQDSKIE